MGNFYWGTRSRAKLQFITYLQSARLHVNENELEQLLRAPHCVFATMSRVVFGIGARLIVFIWESAGRNLSKEVERLRTIGIWIAGVQGVQKSGKQSKLNWKRKFKLLIAYLRAWIKTWLIQGDKNFTNVSTIRKRGDLSASAILVKWGFDIYANYCFFFRFIEFSVFALFYVGVSQCLTRNLNIYRKHTVFKITTDWLRTT